MTNLYYITSSGLILTVPEGGTQIESTFISSSLTVTASYYYNILNSFTSSIEVPQVIISSGSTIYAVLPLESTNIYYNVYPSSYVFPSEITFNVESASFTNVLTFSPISNTTPDNFSLYNVTKTTDVVSSSIAVSRVIPLTVGDTYNIVLSGSGDFYVSNISVLDTVTNTYIVNTSGVNQYISASFSNTETDKYLVLLSVTSSAYISMSFSSSNSIPVSPTSSLSAWNTYFQTTGSNSSFSASFIQNISNDVTLAGGNLGTLTGGIILDNANLINYYDSGISNITSYSFYNNKLTSFPSLISSSNIPYINLGTNLISGSIPDLTPNISLQTLILSNNKLSGSIPNVSSSYNLNYFDISNNYLTGNIDLLKCYNLQYFDASNNKLSGSFTLFDDIGSAYSNIGLIQYFDISNNHLSSSRTNIASLSDLQYFDISNNKFSGSIFSFGNYSLYHFDCSNNNFSGSIPYIQTIEIEFAPTGSLRYFNVSNNHFTGTLYLNDNFLSLQTFIANDNKLNNYISLSGSYFGNSYTKLTTFNAQNNLFPSGSIDNILLDLDISGIVSGTVNLSGSGNEPPSAIGLGYTASLVSKGWTVYVN